MFTLYNPCLLGHGDEHDFTDVKTLMWLMKYFLFDIKTCAGDNDDTLFMFPAAQFTLSLGLMR